MITDRQITLTLRSPFFQEVARRIILERMVKMRKQISALNEVLDSVRAFAATEDRTMTLREHQRLRRAIANLQREEKA